MESSSSPKHPTHSEFDPPPDVDNWLDLIDYLTSELAERDQTLECELEDVAIDVPMRMSPDAETAHWRFDGGVKVSVGEVRVPLREWLRYWDNRSESH